MGRWVSDREYWEDGTGRPGFWITRRELGWMVFVAFWCGALFAYCIMKAIGYGAI